MTTPSSPAAAAQPLPRLFPAEGREATSVLAQIDEWRAADVDWRGGRFHGVCYFAGDGAVEIAQEAFLRYWFESAHASAAFPSVRRLELDLIGMGSELLNAPATHGVVTTGGTESNLLAVWTALCRFRRRHGTTARAKLVLAYSAHPSFIKAAAYFDMELVRTPIDLATSTADPKAIELALDDDAALVVASAPSYPHGVVDPVAEIAAIAGARDVPVHVDACVGGFILPFVERLGRPVPTFDFRVPGVTSVSADLHKMGYAPRPVSLLLFRDGEEAAPASFEFSDWPMGRYSSQGITGSRPAGAIAGAWAVLQHLGENGFMAVTRKVMELTDRVVTGIEAIPGLHIHAQPVANKLAYGARDLDMFAVAAALERRGWMPGLQADPKGINLYIQLFHEESLDDYLTDLAAAVELVRAGEVTGAGKSGAYN